MLFEIHCHSTFSDGRASPKQIVDYAKGFLDGIAVTDHDSILGTLEALKYQSDKFTVIPGMEVSSKDGHILALNVRELLPKDLHAKETIERIHALGGLAIAAHPYDRWRLGVGDLILKLEFDAVEVLNGHTFTNTRDPMKVCLSAGIPVVGGSDAHTLSEIGLVLTEFDGEFTSALKSGRTKVKGRPTTELMMRHGVGLIHRKILKRLGRRGH